MTKTRNRAPKPSWSWSGFDAHAWRASSSHVSWSQNDIVFKQLVTVLTNERAQARLAPVPLTENRLLGRIEGYELALDLLRSLATGLQPASKGDPEPDYKPDTTPTTDSDFIE